MPCTVESHQKMGDLAGTINSHDSLFIMSFYDTYKKSIVKGHFFKKNINSNALKPLCRVLNHDLRNYSCEMSVGGVLS